MNHPAQWTCVQQEDGTYLVDPGRLRNRLCVGYFLLAFGVYCLMGLCTMLHVYWSNFAYFQRQQTINFLIMVVASLMASGCFYYSAFLLFSHIIWRVGHHTFEEHTRFRGRTRKKRYTARAWLLQPSYAKGTLTGYQLELIGVTAPDGQRYTNPSHEQCELGGKWLASVTG